MSFKGKSSCRRTFVEGQLAPANYWAATLASGPLPISVPAGGRAEFDLQIGDDPAAFRIATVALQWQQPVDAQSVSATINGQAVQPLAMDGTVAWYDGAVLQRGGNQFAVESAGAAVLQGARANVALAGATSGTFAEEANVLPGLVAHWTLDETTGAVVHNAAGSVHGENKGVLVGRPGRFGTAYDFFGPSWVDTNSRPIPATGDFSLFAWVLTKQGDTATLLSGHRQQDGRWNVFMTAEGELSFFHHGGVGEQNTDFAINDGQWHHIGVTREGETFTLWFDGVGQKVGTSDAAMNTDYNFIFGGRLTAGGELTERFIGAIDDVQVYHRVLTADEVAHIMVPEPGGAALLGTGAVLLMLSRRRAPAR